MIYVLDHYYSVDHKKYCLVVDMDKTVDEVIEIYSAIEFLLEETVDVSIELDDKCLLKCLEDFYGAKDVKDSFMKKYEFDLPSSFTYDEVYSDKKTGKIAAYIVDLYSARESCLGGAVYKKIMDKWLPKNEKHDEMKNIIQFKNPDSINLLARKYFGDKYPKYKDMLNIETDYSNYNTTFKFNHTEFSWNFFDNDLTQIGQVGFTYEGNFYDLLDTIFYMLTL